MNLMLIRRKLVNMAVVGLWIVLLSTAWCMDVSKANKAEESQFELSGLQIETQPVCSVSPWSSWTSCSSTCGLGTRIRRRDVSCNDGMSPAQCSTASYGYVNLSEEESCGQMCDSRIKADNMHIEPVCSVGPWEPWTSCSSSCGQGTRVRHRGVTCKDGLSSEECLATCSGQVDLTETESCDQMCEVDSTQIEPVCSLNPWTPWTSCSSTCGHGTRFRHRSVTCSNGLTSEECLTTCSGQVDLTETESCGQICDDEIKIDNTPIEPVCSLKPWTSWTSCSSTCGHGTRVRYRSVTCKDGLSSEECLATCSGQFDLTETESCGQICEGEIKVDSMPIEPVCSVNPWRPWTSCSSSCGQGTRVRHRSVTCSNGLTSEECLATCSGQVDLTETEPCGEMCEGDESQSEDELGCTIAPWTPWSSCSSTCGLGTRTRHRDVNCKNNDGNTTMVECSRMCSGKFAPYELKSCEGICAEGDVFGGDFGPLFIRM